MGHEKFKQYLIRFKILNGQISSLCQDQEVGDFDHSLLFVRAWRKSDKNTT